LLKAMGKRVIASDFLNFPAVPAAATVGNSKVMLDGLPSRRCSRPDTMPHFIERTFDGFLHNRRSPLSGSGVSESREPGAG